MHRGERGKRKEWEEVSGESQQGKVGAQQRNGLFLRLYAFRVVASVRGLLALTQSGHFSLRTSTNHATELAADIIWLGTPPFFPSPSTSPV